MQQNDIGSIFIAFFEDWDISGAEALLSFERVHSQRSIIWQH